ncbi:hypothetical protein ZWY2020_040463 [Hordeum vulgare]|nr:hypothetical protein ZWY2020_040463 [Hordeum vulgare]
MATSLSALEPRAPPTSQQLPPPGPPPRFQILRRPSKIPTRGGSHPSSAGEDRRINRVPPPKRASRGASTLTRTIVVTRGRPAARHHLLTDHRPPGPPRTEPPQPAPPAG